MMATVGKSLTEMIRDMFRTYGKREGKRKNVALTSEREKRLNSLREHPPSKLGERVVVGIETIDGIKLDFSDDDWVLLRLSGTEPIIRCYAEAGSKKEVDRLVRVGLELLEKR
jgi:phosphoglucomutase